MSNHTEEQWQSRIIEIAQTIPPEAMPTDAQIASLLVSVIVAEQSTLSEENLSFLVGISAALARRTFNNIVQLTPKNATGTLIA